MALAKVRRILREILRVFNWSFMAFFIGYLALQIIPVQALWFKPGPVRFLDVESGASPVLEFSQVIKVNATMDRSVVVRTSSGFARGQIVCESQTPSRTYKTASGHIVNKDLAWWAPSDQRCGELPDGAYYADTCWHLTDPLGDLISWVPSNILGGFSPIKKICRTSNIFYVGYRPPEQKVIQQAPAQALVPLLERLRIIEPK